MIVIHWNVWKSCTLRARRIIIRNLRFFYSPAIVLVQRLAGCYVFVSRATNSSAPASARGGMLAESGGAGGGGGGGGLRGGSLSHNICFFNLREFQQGFMGAIGQRHGALRVTSYKHQGKN